MTSSLQHDPVTPAPSSFTEVVYSADALSYAQRNSDRCIFTADIGGTNSNFGIILVDDKDKLHLCASFHAKSQQVTDYNELVRTIVTHIKDHFKVTLRRTCWGVAGYITPERTTVTPTNLAVQLNAAALVQNSSLKDLCFINDFEAVGLGLDQIKPVNIVSIVSGRPTSYAQKGYLGAGTGLGYGALIWNRAAERYLPLASEAGHTDCALYTEDEYALGAFVKRLRPTTAPEAPLSWEDLLSGNGISAIYQFLGTHKNYHTTAISEEIQRTRFKPDLISHYAHKDARCFDTFALYARFYGRCTKNLALTTLALNGIYIAGGIAAKNLELFKSHYFKDELYRSHKQEALLRMMPVSVVTDYNISLYGAASFLLLRDQGIL